MYMIGSCPTDNSFNEDESVEALCRRRKIPESYFPHQYSYLIDIPVLSLATNRTYANVYCAQCHSDAHELAQWNITIKCNDNIEKFIFTDLFSSLFLTFTANFCTQQVQRDSRPDVSSRKLPLGYKALGFSSRTLDP